MKRLSEWEIIEIIRDHKPPYSGLNESELARELWIAIYGEEQNMEIEPDMSDTREDNYPGAVLPGDQ